MTYEGSAHRTPAEQARLVAEWKIRDLIEQGDPNPMPVFRLFRPWPWVVLIILMLAFLALAANGGIYGEEVIR